MCVIFYLHLKHFKGISTSTGKGVCLFLKRLLIPAYPRLEGQYNLMPIENVYNRQKKASSNSQSVYILEYCQQS